jgi:hypothetical protein
MRNNSKMIEKKDEWNNFKHLFGNRKWFCCWI